MIGLRSNKASNAGRTTGPELTTVKLYNGQQLELKPSETPAGTEEQGTDISEGQEATQPSHGFEPTTASTCEEVINYICQYILNITPLASHYFGIATPSKDGKDFVWKAFCKSFKTLEKEKLYFRMRFLPEKNKYNNLEREDNKCFQYLYWQVREDFVEHKLLQWTCEGAEMEGKDGRGIAVLSVLIDFRKQAEENEIHCENIEEFYKSIDLKSYLPARMIKQNAAALIEKFLDKRNLKKSMKESVINLQRQNELSSLTCLMQSFFSFLFEKTPFLQGFHEERYTGYRLELQSVGEGQNPPIAVKKQKPLKLEVNFGNVRPYFRVQIANSKTWTTKMINDLLFIGIQELTTIDAKTWWSVNSHGSEPIYFDREETALSFVGGLNQFSRLMYDFYRPLCDELEPAAQKMIKESGVFGPISHESVEKKFEKKQRENKGTYHLIRQSGTHFDSLEILYSTDVRHLEVIDLGQIIQSEGGFRMEGQTKTFESVKKLISSSRRQRAEELSINLETQVKPQAIDVECDQLARLLKKDGVERVLDEDEEKEKEKKRVMQQPKVHLQSAICLDGDFDREVLTEVCKAKLNDNETVTVKRIRVSEVRPELFRKCEESLQESFAKLISLNELARQESQSEGHVFADVLGLVLASPIMMVVKGSDYGSLAQLLQHQRPGYRLSLRQKEEAALLVVQGLLFLSGQTDLDSFHGNICCRNILVTHFSSGSSIKVKIADPGLITVYNELPLNDPVNKQRIPWMSPSLFVNMKNMSPETDIYAFGTTLWEMFSGGASPVDEEQPLHGMSTKKMVEFIESGNHFLSAPVDLEPQPDDANNDKKMKKKIVNIMKKCWLYDGQPDSKDVVKDLIALGVYDPYYHEYNLLLPDNTSPLSESNSEEVQTEIELIPWPKTQLPFLGEQDPDVTQLKLNPQTPQESQTLHTQIGASATKTLGIENQGKRPASNNVGPSSVMAAREQSQSFPGPVRPKSAAQTQPFNNSCPVRNASSLIRRDRLEFDTNQVLGKGFFGTVYRGTLEDRMLKSARPVAVKVPSGDNTEIFKETQAMESLKHENIVQFLGVIIPENFLVMELVEKGSLLNYMKKLKKESMKIHLVQQLSFCRDIAAGMEYLSSKSVIHCDLAARNVLLTSDLRAKVSDFGLVSLLDQGKDYYRRKTKNKSISIHWIAPEFFTHAKIDVKLDVWSFGIVLWEVFSYGESPAKFPDSKGTHDGEIVQAKITFLENGNRLPQPNNCPDSMYTEIMRCWEFQPQDRPDFKTLFTSLQTSYESEREKLPPGTSLTDPLSPLQQMPTNPSGSVSPMAGNEDYSKGRLEVNSDSLEAGVEVQTVHHGTFIEEDDIIFRKDKRSIGTGRFGIVLQGEWKCRGTGKKEVAIKYFNAEEKMRARFDNEIKIHSALKQHPNIVEFYGILDTKGRKLAFVMEYIQYVDIGDLSTYLKRCKTNGAPQGTHRRLSFLLDVAKGMAYLASQNVLHLDLNTENVLLDKDLTAKICDFGLAKYLGNHDDTYSRIELLFRQEWTAPEVSKDQTYHRKSDVYSFGILSWVVFSDGDTPKRQKDRSILNQPSKCSDVVWNMIIRPCWTRLPDSRPSFDALANGISGMLHHTPPDPVVKPQTVKVSGNLHIHSNEKLGEGHYGTVYLGMLIDEGIQKKVAVKALKQDKVEKYMEDFKKEARIMAKLSHENIVKLYGVFQEGQYLVMEYVEKGSLIKYLHKKRDRQKNGTDDKCVDDIETRNASLAVQLSFAVDIAAGMEYLSGEMVIHCDLAARNILVTKDLRAKVSDFGLAKILTKDQDYYRRSEHKTLPIFWCAPEWMGMPNKFTTSCDVWSYGVVLWEIYTYGKTPNICQSLEDFMKHGMSKLDKGMRLPQPDKCPNEVYTVMQDCWHSEGSKRPTFSALHTRLLLIRDTSPSKSAASDTNTEHCV